MTVQGVERYKTKLLLHDNDWDIEFHEAKARIEKIWDKGVPDIQHIGSTSIKQICAKPILDIAVVFEAFDK